MDITDQQKFGIVKLLDHMSAATLETISENIGLEKKETKRLLKELIADNKVMPARFECYRLVVKGKDFGGYR